MVHDRSWYIDLHNRAQSHVYTSYPYTDESLDRADVIRALRSAIWELLDENEKQAAEIAKLKERLEKKPKVKAKGTVSKKPRKGNER